MTRLDELRALLDRALVELPADELPEMVGLLAAADARARARLNTAPAPAATPSPALLTAEEVAEHFAVPRTHVYALARQGRLPHVKVGRYPRFNLSELCTALASGELRAPAEPPPRARRARRVPASSASSKTASLRTPKKPSNSAHLHGAATALLPLGQPPDEQSHDR
jgi:excisionase family DNA binding protein